jgi:serine/threonine protein kinase
MHFNCPDQEELVAYFEGAGPEITATRLEEHLEQCTTCVDILETLEHPVEDRYVVFLNRIAQTQTDSAMPADEHAGPIAELIERLLKLRPVTSTPRVSSISRIGNYEILEPIDQGGMGSIYRGRHVSMDREVAVKLLRPDRVGDSRSESRFELEMRAVARMSHPNVVRAFDAGRVMGMHYLVMELVEGVDLSNLLRKFGKLPIPVACEIVRQTALGLGHVHDHALIHRDLKPANILLTYDGNIKVLDLGLAMLHDLDARERLTSDEHVLGTLDYMAPEQLTDSRHVDHRVDIYSLGATLLKLLTGSTPHASTKYKSAMDRFRDLATGRMPEIDWNEAGVPIELQSVLMKMLATDSLLRYESASEVAESLAPFASASELQNWLKQNELATAIPPKIVPAPRLTSESPAPIVKPESQREKKLATLWSSCAQ